MRCELRQAKWSDAPAIRDLTRAAYQKWVPVIGREPKPMMASYETAVRSHRFDLLYLDGELSALIETINQGDCLLVVNVAVAPGKQGKGLGSRLMRHAESIARAQGCRRIWLYTNQCFAENIRLYASLGYAIDRIEQVDGGAVRVDMSKSLADDG